jgi:hypothetical protein
MVLKSAGIVITSASKAGIANFNTAGSNSAKWNHDAKFETNRSGSSTRATRGTLHLHQQQWKRYASCARKGWHLRASIPRWMLLVPVAAPSPTSSCAPHTEIRSRIRVLVIRTFEFLTERAGLGFWISGHLSSHRE